MNFTIKKCSLFISSLTLVEIHYIQASLIIYGKGYLNIILIEEILNHLQAGIHVII